MDSSHSHKESLAMRDYNSHMSHAEDYIKLGHLSPSRKVNHFGG